MTLHAAKSSPLWFINSDIDWEGRYDHALKQHSCFAYPAFKLINSAIPELAVSSVADAYTVCINSS